jgi:hypothetical protein
MMMPVNTATARRLASCLAEMTAVEAGQTLAATLRAIAAWMRERHPREDAGDFASRFADAVIAALREQHHPGETLH